MNAAAFDVSLHLALRADLGAIDRFSEFPRERYGAIVDAHARALREDGASGGHLWCADPRWAADSAAVGALSSTARAAGLRLSACVDPRDARAASLAGDARLDGYVLSPVHSSFDPAALVRAPEWARFCASAASLAKPAFVTTAYGTRDLYERDSLLLLADLLRRLPGAAPVVALHGGGHRFLDLALLADAHANLSIDLSFTLEYYAGSSLPRDWAWAMRKLGPRRFLFGSDEPFASRKRSLAAFGALMDEAGWSAGDKALPLAGNAARLFAAQEAAR